MKQIVCFYENIIRDVMKYIVGEKGTKISIIVPSKRWKKKNSDYKKLQKKVELLTGLKEALKGTKHSKKETKFIDLFNTVESGPHYNYKKQRKI